MQQEFSKRLILLRMKQQMTQEELAQKTGVTRQAISKWERAEGLPDLYNVQCLAKALGVSVDELIGQGTTFQESPDQDYKFNYQKAGNYFTNLVNKAKNTANSEEAKAIRKKLLRYGGFGLLVGLLMVVGGFISFATYKPGSAGINSSGPIGAMVVFMLGGLVSGLSLYVLFAGFSIFAAGVSTKFLDTRDKCPNCNDGIDSDEKKCSKCGYDLEGNKKYRCSCGKINQAGDTYCRTCGTKLN